MTKSNKQALRKQLLMFGVSFACVVFLGICLFALNVWAAPTVSIDVSGEAEGGAGPLEILFLIVVLALAPSILVMMTSFTRIVIVLSFLRNALGTQQTPPNQVLIGLSLFLTLFIMFPVLQEIQEVAYNPYKDGEITSEVALERAQDPLKGFMIKQTKQEDLELFLSIAQEPWPETVQGDFETPEDARLETLKTLGLHILVPSFITSELKRAFLMGFMLFIPFLIIDMVVSSTLMSMGMVMLPPSMIALPFKLMMFVLVDGWGNLFGTLVSSFRL